MGLKAITLAAAAALASVGGHAASTSPVGLYVVPGIFFDGGASAAGSTGGAAAGSTAGASLFWTITSFLATLGIDSVSLCVFLRVMRRSTSVHANPLAHVDLRERLFLVNLGVTFAHQLECRREGRRHHGRGERGLDHIGNQE